VLKLLAGARQRLKSYDSLSKAHNRYNPAAVTAYRCLATGRMPQNSRAWSALHVALMKFDMHRQLAAMTTPKGPLQLAALRRIFAKNAPRLRPLLVERICSLSAQRHSVVIASLFDALSKRGAVVPGKRFTVGTTKALHFLNPELFPIIDSRVAKKLRSHTQELPTSATAYAGYHYALALQVIAKEIRLYGVGRLRSLQPSQPLLRIVDKVLFA
jgi:hypothetical protein